MWGLNDMNSVLVNGKIPAHTVCPYRDQCEYAKQNECNHRGVDHTIPFSCGAARLFKIFLREPDNY